MTTTLTPFRDRTVGDIAAKLAGASALFRQNRIDFCCGGDIPLAEAAAQRGVDIADLERALKALADTPPDAPQDPADLVAHIISRFHDVHRRELPELVKLARKVEAVHRDHPDAPHGLADLLERAEAELGDHMAKEEQILFPTIRSGFAGSLDMPIWVMRNEHEDHGQIVYGLQALAHDFATPEGACRSWQALYAGVAKFVADLTEHIHLENNVLFPRYQSRRAERQA